MSLSPSLRSLALAATLLAALTACKKDSNDPTPTPDNGPTFVGKKWSIQAMTLSPKVDLDGDGTLDDNLLVLMPDCSKDDLVIFQGDKKVTNENGSSRCDDDEPATEQTGTWEYQQAASSLRITDTDGDVQDWKVLEASGSTFKVQYTIDELTTAGQTYKATLTMKAK